MTINKTRSQSTFEVPDELLELPYNASDSRQSLHNGGGGATHSETISNGAIPIQMGSSNGEHYYQPDIDDTGQSAMIKIDVPAEVSRDEPKFPKEKLKTFYSFVILVLNFILTTTSLALVHERLPDRDKYGPLPDVVLDNIAPLDWALDVSEVLIMIQVYSCVILIAFHKHRFIVMKRVNLMLSLLYLMRSFTIFVTVLPVPSTTYFCSPKANSTSAMVITKRVFQLMSGFGLSINGKHTYCGDYIYSGHTVMLVMGYLIIVEYSPKNYVLVHWAAMINAMVGVAMVLLAHGHYTIDVVIAYYVTTRLFWVYHTLSNNVTLKQSSPHNLLSREWWFGPFKYFERNIRGPVPRQYDCPFSWPWPRRRGPVAMSRVPGRES